VFWRGLGRLLFLPPLWILLHGKAPGAFLDAGRALGTRRILLGTVLNTIHNVAFVLAGPDTTSSGSSGAAQLERL